MPAAVTCQVKRLTTRSRPAAPSGARSAGSSSSRAMAAGQRAGVVRRHQQAGLAVGAHDLGQRAAGGRHHGHAAGHGLDGRQREALVQRGHHGHLGLAVEPGQLVVADAADALHRVGQAQPGDGPVDPAALGWGGR